LASVGFESDAELDQA